MKLESTPCSASCPLLPSLSETNGELLMHRIRMKERTGCQRVDDRGRRRERERTKRVLSATLADDTLFRQPLLGLCLFDCRQPSLCPLPPHTAAAATHRQGGIESERDCNSNSRARAHTLSLQSWLYKVKLQQGF